MATQNFDLQIQMDGTYIGDRIWDGDDMHALWNVENLDTISRSEWGLSSGGWLQYRSLLSTYSMRYSLYDQQLSDCYFETDMSAGGTGNYEFGVMFRFKDRSNFYYVVWNGGYQNWDGKNIRLMKRIGTSNFKLADYAIGVFDRTKEYKIRVEAVGAHIKVMLNDVVIFDLTDSSFPILSGAFGPIVKGQEFARWKEFRALSVTPFTLTKRVNGLSVESSNYDPSTAIEVSAQSVGEYVADVTAAHQAGISNVQNYKVTKYIMNPTNIKVRSIFDRTLGKNTTSDPASKMYAFQDPPSAPPIPVTDLRGTPVSTSSIRLAWSHADMSEDGFKIVDENGAVVGTVGMDVFTFLETGLNENTTYKRRVVPYNMAGDSVTSNEVAVTTFKTVPRPPTLFTFVEATDDTITWAWTDDSFNEEGFEIVRLLEDGSEMVVGSVDANVNTWIEEGLTPLTEYTRAVRAKNTAGISVRSNTATGKTLDRLPDPPTRAPQNFTGVGTAHDTILWSWTETNTVRIDGYYLYDENGVRIATLPNNQNGMHSETGLYSLMEYRRSISAFNEGGEGPRTPLAWAKTLSYGEDQEGTPLEPFNLSVQDITTNSAVLKWDYEEHERLVATGFKIYNDLDQVVDIVPVSVQERMISDLTDDTAYSFYVVAYNETGDSLPSNSVTFVTEKIMLPEEPTGPVDENFPEDWVDPWYGVEYDTEQEDTPKIEAFQAGVGDNLDLVVRNKKETNYENAEYELFITGEYETQEEFYPEVPFRYQLTAEGVNRDSSPYVVSSNVIEGVVQGGEDNTDIRHDSLILLDPIPDTVSVTNDSFNIKVWDEDGNEIPAYVSGVKQDLYWVHEIRTRSEEYGDIERIEMENVYNGWYKFSHNGSGRQPANAGELDAWEYVLEDDEILTTVNSSTYIGAVSPDLYKAYDINMRLTSRAMDNDDMAFILAFVIDEDGREHTISAIRSHQYTAWNWAIVYNFSQSDSFVIGSKKLVGTGNWSSHHPVGTHIRAVRNDDLFEVYSSDAGSETVREDSKIVIDLNSDRRLEKFKGARAIGVAARSQQYASLKLFGLTAKRTRVFYDNYITVWTDKKDIDVSYLPWQSAKFKSHPVRIAEGERKLITGRIQSPQYQLPWQEINEVYPFHPDRYRINITSLNPNVELLIQKQVEDFFPSDSTFVSVLIEAKIINHTQTSWHPSVHSGYYYLNQREHFLYSDDKVLPKDSAGLAQYVYDFPYIITAYAERHYLGGDLFLTDTSAQDFSLGESGEGIVINPINHTLSLSSETPTGMFTSKVFEFGQMIESWNDPVILQNEAMITGGASVEIEIGEADETGNVAEWKQPSEMTPAKRVRYKVTLSEGEQRDDYLARIELSTTDLQESYLYRTKVSASQVVIEDALFYAEGTFVTKGIDSTPYIKNIGQVTFTMNTPDGSAFEVYSVTADNRNHAFEVPTANEPWIPLRLVHQVGNQYTYKIDSQINQYIAFVFKLKRGMKEIVSAQAELDKNTFEPLQGHNVTVFGEDIIVVDPALSAIYESRNINLGTFEYWGALTKEWYMEEETRVDIYTITAPTSAELDAKVENRAAWQKVTDDRIYSAVDKWMRYRIEIAAGSDSLRMRRMLIEAKRKIGVSPELSTIIYQPQLYNPVRTVPVIDSISIGGYVPQGFWAEEYTVPMMGQLVADEEIYPITEKMTKELVLDHLASIGVHDIAGLSFKDYLVSADPIYPVELNTDRSGSDRVYAKTTAVVGDIIYQEERLYFDAEKQEVLVRPIPQNGSPIFIRNAQGTVLRPVHFRDESYKPTLTNMEILETNETRHLFIQYRAHEIDARTLRVWVDMDGQGGWKEIFGSTIVENRIILPYGFLPFLAVRAMYRLKDSYCVDYNYTPDKDDARIQVHTSFDPEVEETRRLEIRYEVNKQHAYYLADEIDLNPLKNKIHSGFMYLTDELYPPARMKVICNPAQVYKNQKERVTVHAYLYDEFGNPVVGERIGWEVDEGTIYIMSSITDMNGLSVAIYEAPASSAADQAIIKAQLISRDSSIQLDSSCPIVFSEENFVNKIAVIPEKHIVQSGDTVQLKITAFGPSSERLANKTVTIRSSQGTVLPSNGATTFDGELVIQYNHPPADAESYTVITVESDETKEEIILGASGV